MKKRVMINELNVNIKGVIAGWLIKECDGWCLKDITSKIKIYSENTDIDFNNYFFMECEGELKKNIFYVSRVLKGSETNRINTKKHLSIDYKSEPYLYYLTDEIHNIQKEKIELQNIARKFLNNNHFLEVDFPTLFSPVNEYGENEWEAINTVNDERFSLLQSAEMPSLLCCIGGLERTFSFSKCFRISPEMSENSIIEFTQLIFSLCFCDLMEGKELTNNLIKELMHYFPKKKYRISEIEYKKSLLLYGDDKPDFRYKKVFYPKLNDPTKACQVWNCEMNPSELMKILKKLNNNIKPMILSDHEEIKKKIDDLSFMDYLEGPFTALIIDKEFSNIFSVLTKLLYKKHFEDYCDYHFVWVTNYLFNDNRKFNNNMEENNYCIFSNIEEKALDETINGEEYSQIYNTNTSDLILNGIEIATCGTRVKTVQHFLKMCKAHKIENPEIKFNYYINALKNGVPDHFVIGIGWERIIYILLNLKKIDYIQLFPKHFLTQNV